ncbi:hypothetical protein [Tsukamurella hominis]|uniref:hypothetical protein n=1 Tax=Tsukamurella hominis TaxID=1970232 RepID=UPI0039EB5DE7
MAKATIKLRSAGFAALAKSAGARTVVTKVAEGIAANTKDANVAQYTTDRAVAAVELPAYQQARNGELTRAAARNGISVS